MAGVQTAPVVWSELDRTLASNAQGDITLATNVEAVRNSIENILATMMGERVMRMSFASRMRAALFEPNDEALQYAAAAEVREVIEAWDDRVAVAGVSFETDPEHGWAKIGVRYRVVGYQDVFQLERKY